LKEREHECRWGEGWRERSRLPAEQQSPTQGWIPGPWDHDLSRNQELAAQPTEPPGHPHNNFKCTSFYCKKYEKLIKDQHC